MVCTVMARLERHIVDLQLWLGSGCGGSAERVSLVAKRATNGHCKGGKTHEFGQPIVMEEGRELWEEKAGEEI